MRTVPRHDHAMTFSVAALDRRIDEVIVDAYGEHEQLEAFACMLDELAARPVAATVLGEPVELVGVEAAGELLGLRARCHRAGSAWEVALVDVVLEDPAHKELDLTLAAYRHWVAGTR